MKLIWNMLGGIGLFVIILFAGGIGKIMGKVGAENFAEEKNEKSLDRGLIKIAEKLNYVGVLAIEFFQVGEQLLVNEIAPRVHNSGHWTQQGADTCQFENHLRAICGLPLGGTQLIRPTAMVNIIGEDDISPDIYAIPSVSMHWYDKEKRTGRKMGHINLSGCNEVELAERLVRLSTLLNKESFPDLNEFSTNYLAKVSQ